MARKIPSDHYLQKVIRRIVAEGSGLDFGTAVIPANDSGPVPEKLPYATVLQNDLEFPGVGSESVEPVADEGSTEVDLITFRPIVGRWDIDWYRSSEQNGRIITPRDRAAQFEQWCDSQIGLLYIAEQTLWDDDRDDLEDKTRELYQSYLTLSYHECLTGHQADEVVSFGWEARAGLEFVASYNQVMVHRAESIDCIPFALDALLPGDVSADVSFDISLS